MSYKFKQEELYGRALFSIQNKTQELLVAFEPSEGDSFIMIIYSGDGNPIQDHHNTNLWDTLFNVMLDFDDGNYFDYEIIAT